MRRAEICHHHHIAGVCLLRHAEESSWRKVNRRLSIGAQVDRLTKPALQAKPSVEFGGDWQRHVRSVCVQAVGCRWPAKASSERHWSGVDNAEGRFQPVPVSVRPASGKPQT